MAKNETPQWQRIINYMKEHGSITSMDAIYHLGCTRLAGRIFEIKERGYNIETELVNTKTRYGTTKIAVYRLGKDD